MADGKRGESWATPCSRTALNLFSVPLPSPRRPRGNGTGTGAGLAPVYGTGSAYTLVYQRIPILSRGLPRTATDCHGPALRPSESTSPAAPPTAARLVGRAARRSSLAARAWRPSDSTCCPSARRGAFHGADRWCCTDYRRQISLLGDGAGRARLAQVPRARRASRAAQRCCRVAPGQARPGQASPGVDWRVPDGCGVGGAGGAMLRGCCCYSQPFAAIRSRPSQRRPNA